MATTGSDPLADFLARERDEFAVLDDDETFGTDFNRPTQINGFNGTDENNTNLVDDIELFGGETNLSENIMSTGAGAAVVGALPVAADFRPQTAVTPPPLIQRIEPEKIRKWREDQKSRLENKDAHEEQEKDKWRDQAKKEVQDWYKMRDEQMEKTKKNNKTAEQEFVRERDADLPGQEWERIARLCEFNPKASKNTKDVSRMRTLLLQMKSAN